MRLHEVKYKEDCRRVKAPGVSETEVKVCSLYYAAETPEAVWDSIADIRADPERRFKSIAEVLPLLTVVSANPTPAEQK